MQTPISETGPASTTAPAEPGRAVQGTGWSSTLPAGWQQLPATDGSASWQTPDGGELDVQAPTATDKSAADFSAALVAGLKTGKGYTVENTAQSWRVAGEDATATELLSADRATDLLLVCIVHGGSAFAVDLALPTSQTSSSPDADAVNQFLKAWQWVPGGDPPSSKMPSTTAGLSTTDTTS